MENARDNGVNNTGCLIMSMIILLVLFWVGFKNVMMLLIAVLLILLAIVGVGGFILCGPIVGVYYLFVSNDPVNFLWMKSKSSWKKTIGKLLTSLFCWIFGIIILAIAFLPLCIAYVISPLIFS
jgi:hypothetical protein